MGRVLDRVKERIRAAIENAEQAVQSGRPGDAVALLQPFGTDLPDFGRKLLLEAARGIGNRPLLIDLLTPPRAIVELVELGDRFSKSCPLLTAAMILSESLVQRKGKGPRWFRQEPLDGGLKLDDGAEDAALQSPSGQLGEIAFDGVEPRCGRGGEGGG